MILIQGCLTGVGLSKKHEFGDWSRAEMWVLELIFFKVYFIKFNSDFSDFFRGYTSQNFDWHPQVRLAKNLAWKRARAQADKDWQDRHNWLLKHANNSERKVSELRNENAALLKTIKLVGRADD